MKLRLKDVKGLEEGGCPGEEKEKEEMTQNRLFWGPSPPPTLAGGSCTSETISEYEVLPPHVYKKEKCRQGFSLQSGGKGN